VQSIIRYSTRSLIIPFKCPTVGPKTEKETSDFSKLLAAAGKASSAVGWAINIGRFLEEGAQFHDDLLTRTRAKLVGVNSRLCTAYATLLFCVEKVSVEATQYIHVRDDQCISACH